MAEHLDLLARVHGVADPAAAVDEVLDDVGLTRRGRPAAGHAVVRAAAAAAARLLLRPARGRCCVLDEPEQRLDVPGRAWLARRLVAEKESGVGVLLSCHDPRWSRPSPTGCSSC